MQIIRSNEFMKIYFMFSWPYCDIRPKSTIHTLDNYKRCGGLDFLVRRGGGSCFIFFFLCVLFLKKSLNIMEYKLVVSVSF
jgi:hypothetical protein